MSGEFHFLLSLKYPKVIIKKNLILAKQVDRSVTFGTTMYLQILKVGI